MWLVNFFTSSVAGDIIFKLFIAFLLSIIIGIERELFHKPAGVKTHLLICMSSTLIMSLSLYMYNLYGASSSGILELSDFSVDELRRILRNLQERTKFKKPLRKKIVLKR